MPVPAPHRQPDALGWFATPAGCVLTSAEVDIIHSLLPAWSTQTWLWLAPGSQAPPAVLADYPRGLWLHAQAEGFAGSIRCRLPLPLPTESLRHIVVQHLHDAYSASLLEECARVLEPGGRLWLFSLNPYSPYRWRWRHSGLQSRSLADWDRQLLTAGLQSVAGGARYLGPVWGSGRGAAPTRLRAICLLEVEKRVAGLIPPAAITPTWRTRNAHASSGLASWPHARQRKSILLKRTSCS